MNYCSYCGSDKIVKEIPKNEDVLRSVCSNCKTIHYVNPNIIVGCIVEYDGKILLAKRGIEPRMNYWNLPCGFLEMSENVEDGAIREVYEETGLQVEIIKLQTVYNVVHSGQVYLIFSATADNSNFKETFETLESKFFSPDEIPWDEIAFSANTYALKKYINFDSKTKDFVHIGSTLN